MNASNQSGYLNLPVTKVPGWYGTIAWDALLNGMATGLFLAAAVSELAAPGVFTPVAKIAYPAALALLLADLGLLVFDLGDPLRFHHMLRVFKPGSPMSLGTWCLTIFSLPLTAAAALSLLAEIGFDFERARMLAVVVGLLPGFGAAAYKGVLLSTNAQPGWKDARWLGGYLTNSALLMGCAELLVLSALMGQTQATAILRTAFIVPLVLNLIPLGLLFANLQPAHARLYTRQNPLPREARLTARTNPVPESRQRRIDRDSIPLARCKVSCPAVCFRRRAPALPRGPPR
jgi:Ni/Fe-hydrogenase subunit HybB-like protein